METLQREVCVLNADSVETLPVGEGVLTTVGMYELDEETQQRQGRIDLYLAAHEFDLSHPLVYQSSLNVTGVFDMKWDTRGGASRLAVATAGGAVSLYTAQNTGSWKLSEQDSTCPDEDAMMLSVGWRDPSTLVASSSTGKLCMIDVSPSGLSEVQTWCGHDCYGGVIEAWIASFSSWDPNLLFSGGDDSKLKCWDLRDTTRPISVSSHHTMGVCSIQSSPYVPHILLTGSYDDTLCEWDERALKEPLRHCKIGGGVWRIKYSPSNEDHVAIAGMYSGFHVVSGFAQAAGDLSISLSYTKQTSIAYGIDWVRGDVLASASFYDKSLHVWRV